MINNKAFIIFCLMFGFCSRAIAGTITIGPEQSNVLFRINHDLGYTVGYFKDFAATLEVGDDPTQILAIKAQVQTASISTRNAIRDEGLESNLFLDAGQFPQATFESTKIEGDQIIGLLTIKGVTKPMTFTIQQDSIGKKVLLRGVFDRNDFGITYNKLMANKKKSIGDKVELILELKV